MYWVELLQYTEALRYRPIFPTDFNILTTLGFGYVGGLEHTDGVGKFLMRLVSGNPSFFFSLRMLKSVVNIG